MFNMNERVYNQQSQSASVTHQVSMFHPQSSQVIHPQLSQVPTVSLQSLAYLLQVDKAFKAVYSTYEDIGDRVDSLPGAYSLTTNPIFQPDEIDLYDSDYDDISTEKAVLMANLSSYGSDVLSEVPHYETYQNDMANQSVQAMQNFEQTPVVDFPDNEITSDKNIIPYSQYL
ncbi:hypothetical protein Tco_0008090 [Tanacetum coccineum]